MPRYIDADEFEKRIKPYDTDDRIEKAVYIFAHNMMMSTPTADVVEVIRCKDCMHRPTGTGVNHDLEFPDYVCPCHCEDYWYSWMPDDDWFCADGERRD